MLRTRLLVLLLAVVAAIVAALLLWPRDAVDQPPPPSAQSRLQQGAVLLIPGYGGGTRELTPLQVDLERRGLDAEFLDVGTGEGDLRDYARLAAERSRQLQRAGAPAPDVVGYSAGGLTARIAATEHPQLFRKIVMLATPNAGTQTAELGAQFGRCPTACEQMRPGSELLENLPEPDDPSTWLSVWSDTDSVIRPPDSSVLPGATDYRLQQACDHPVEHGAVPGEPQTLSIVAAFLQGAPLPANCVA